MRVISGVAAEKELFSDYNLFESSLLQLLGDQTANTILTFLHDEHSMSSAPNDEFGQHLLIL
jgi:hypothetical protein